MEFLQFFCLQAMRVTNCLRGLGLSGVQPLARVGCLDLKRTRRYFGFPANEAILEEAVFGLVWLLTNREDLLVDLIVCYNSSFKEREILKGYQ